MPHTLHSDLPRGSSHSDAALGPSACFQAGADIARTASLQFEVPNDEGRIFLGVIGGAVAEKRLEDGRVERHAQGGQPIGVPDDRHIITIAGSRSGKGRSGIVPNLITYPGSVLAIDPKGDLAALTADWRKERMGQKVVVLDPFVAAGGVTARHGGGFNPLTILKLRSETLLEDAGLIADALIVSRSERDPHWDESAKQFLEGVILHVGTWPDYVEKDLNNLATVYNILMEDVGSLRAGMKENPIANFAVTTLASQFFDKPERERESVMSNLRRHIRFLGYGQIQRVLRAHSFDLSQLKTEPTTVYLSLPAMRMGSCAGWLRLFVNLTLAALEAEKQKPEYPVLMLLDEFAALGYMKTLEDAAGQIAGLGCKLWPILQDIGQLMALYGNRWETFMGNAGVMNFFGNADLQTLGWISSRLGETTIRTENRSQPGYRERSVEGATGRSLNEAVHPLLTPEEISRFFGRDDKLLRQLVIRPTWSPMILQRVHYDTHELFAPYRDFMTQRAYETE